MGVWATRADAASGFVDEEGKGGRFRRARRSVGDTMARKDFKSCAHVAGGGDRADLHAVTGASRKTVTTPESSQTLTF